MGQDGSREYGRRSVVSVMNWIGTLIVLAIPVVNLIMLIVWAITCRRASKRNFCIATLVVMLIGIAIALSAVALYGDVIAQKIEQIDAGLATPAVVEPVVTEGESAGLPEDADTMQSDDQWTDSVEEATPQPDAGTADVSADNTPEEGDASVTP